MADEITITILNIYLSKQLHDVYRSLCVKSNWTDSHAWLAVRQCHQNDDLMQTCHVTFSIDISELRQNVTIDYR